MEKITDSLIEKCSKAIVNDNPVEALYLFFDDVQVGSDMFEVSNKTDVNELVVTLRIMKKGWVRDFIDLVRDFNVDSIIDNMRYEKSDCTINMPSVRSMLVDYEEYSKWLNRIADVFLSALTAREIFNT